MQQAFSYLKFFTIGSLIIALILISLIAAVVGLLLVVHKRDEKAAAPGDKDAV